MTALSGCAGLGLPPTAPLTTPALSPEAGTPGATPSPTDGTPTQAAPTDTPPSEPSPTGGASTSPADSVARLPGGNGSATPLLVPTSALPTGWTATPARDTRGYRMTVCGVDLEPSDPVDGAQQNWQASAAGPYLEQHVRVYADDTAATVTKALASKIPDCTTYTAKDGDGGQSTFTVEKLSLDGAPAGVVAWRQRVRIPVPGSATGTSSPTTAEVVQDVAVRRTGASVVLLNAYGVGKNPDDAVLVDALKAIGSPS